MPKRLTRPMRAEPAVDLVDLALQFGAHRRVAGQRGDVLRCRADVLGERSRLVGVQRELSAVRYGRRSP
jgi:hypothetical protein